MSWFSQFSVTDPLREFEEACNSQAERYFDAMPREHPVAVMMRERFGDKKKDWAVEINRLMTNLVPRGSKQTTPRQLKTRLERELGWSHAELKTLAPVAERLTDVNRGIYSHLARRMSRLNAGRMTITREKLTEHLMRYHRANPTILTHEVSDARLLLVHNWAHLRDVTESDEWPDDPILHG